LRARHGGDKSALPSLAGALARRTPSSVRAATAQIWSPSTPRASESSLTTAAKSLLGRTGVRTLPAASTSMAPPKVDDETKRRARELERDAQERIKRARWDP